MKFRCKIITYLILLNTIPALANTSSQQTTLPLQFDLGNPAPYGGPSTVITIEGKQLPVIFDTGAKKFEIMLTQQALKNLHVAYTHTQTCSLSLSEKHCHQQFTIPEMKLGDFVLKNVKGAVLDKLWGGSDADFKGNAASQTGLIGYGLLSKYNLLLDYPNSKAILTMPNSKPSGYNTNHWVALNFKDHLITNLKINGKALTFSWDTGAIPSVINQQRFAQQYLSPCPTKAPYAQDCIGLTTTSILNEENQRLPNTWFLAREIPKFAPFDGLIGSNFFAENLVYFDFDHHKIFVKPKM